MNARRQVSDSRIEAALDTKLGLDHTLRQLIRGDTMAVGFGKVDVVRALLQALAVDAIVEAVDELLGTYRGEVAEPYSVIGKLRSAMCAHHGSAPR